MDDRIAFDVYAILKDPPFRVEFVAEADRVEVVFGGPSVCDEPANVLNLWLSSPTMAVALGQELMKYGQRFYWTRKEAETLAEDAGVEVYPVPTAKGGSGSAGQAGVSGGERGHDA
jgi:hypothetical protein